MARTAEEWSDRYYEQQALHTESNGMLCQERDTAKALLEDCQRTHSAGMDRLFEALALTPDYDRKYSTIVLEIRHLKEVASAWHDKATKHAELVEQLKTDAERYLWLRSEDTATNPLYYPFWQEFNAKLCREEHMDALIDSARTSRLVSAKGQ